MKNEQFEDLKENEYDDESDSGEYSDSGIAGSSVGGVGGRDAKSKTKRRSKNDNSGRDFICGCGAKRYLSYPALYTHIKQKHGGVTPAGTDTSQPYTGRGRGRPRKTLGEVNKHNKRIDVGDEEEGQATGLFNAHTISSAGPSEQMIVQMTEKVQEETLILKELKGVGGPTNPLEWFCNVSHLSFQMKKIREMSSST